MASYQDESNEYRELVQTVMQVFNEWGVEPDEQVTLLGLPEDTRPRALNRYRAGMAFPEESAFVQRAHYILSIKNAVDSIYPHNVVAANYWVTTDNYFFDDKSPLEIMLAEGLEGMQRILNHLNGMNE